jgi:serine/threonine protein kinase
VIGQRVNNYEIVSLLGEGGMGAVWLATHPFMGRKAAVKLLRRELVEDRGLVERFMNEARAANAIHHPNIIDIIDVGLLPTGVPYLMMEYLEGDTLARAIQERGTIPTAEAIDIAVQTASALSAAHSKGIVHRDLKPENLFLVPDDTRVHGVRVVVLDFGIAKLRGELAGNSAKTQNGALMGTPPYMSPEQCRGLIDEIDERTDIYAMGIILYQMLCGNPPFVSAGWGDVVLMHLTQPPKAPRTINPNIPPALENAVLKALAKNREARFATMGAMEAALRAAGNMTPVSQRVPAVWTPLSTSPPVVPTGATTATTPKNPTTFRTATGEVETAVLGSHRKRWWAVGAVGTAVTAVVIVALVAGSGKHEKAGEATTPPAAPAAALPAPAAPATAPTPPAPPAEVLIRLASDPPGAQVTDTRSGQLLGSTPFEKRLPRGSAPLSVRLAKDGFAPSKISVPLGADQERTISLAPAPKPTGAAAAASAPRHHSSSRSSHAAPAVASPAHAAATPVHPAEAPPAPAQAQPPKPKPQAEKW